MNSADQLLYKAALLVDEGDGDGAVELLREAIALCEVAGHDLQLLRARTFLGELLAGLDRLPDARSELEQVLVMAERFQGERRLIDQERERAEELLAWIDAES